MFKHVTRTLLSILFCTLIPQSTHAKPVKGFHTGPYLQLVTGAVSADFDVNLQNGSPTGRDVEFAVGFMFGWHINDHIGPFLEARYSTDGNSGSRLHIINGNVGATYTFIFDALTNFKSLRILPFLGPDVAMQIAALPSDPSVGTGVVDRYGVGPGVVGGINFLFSRYVYLGVMAQGDFPYFIERSQVISGSSTPVYAGGWDKQWGVSFNTGVHF
ncbi:MAG: hypothetical protein COV45_08135 [Deltaproteobacteria bacterium CG11_big_fil_rev_8_21_14_0_20_47_16]|nr:MAG: hypothetical protein COV45_08135 [Deltaproteobacteria bacterium CG11_big_fil_rev_8_21_14_0_20_47_16]